MRKRSKLMHTRPDQPCRASRRAEKVCKAHCYRCGEKDCAAEMMITSNCFWPKLCGQCAYGIQPDRASHRLLTGADAMLRCNATVRWLVLRCEPWFVMCRAKRLQVAALRGEVQDGNTVHRCAAEHSDAAVVSRLTPGASCAGTSCV